MKKTYIIQAITTLILLSGCAGSQTEIQKIQDLPSIFPDYCEVTVPLNIAPLHFQLTDDPLQTEVLLEGTKSEPIRVRTKSVVTFRRSVWRKMLEKHAGTNITVTVRGKYPDRGWIEYKPFSLYISTVPIDDYLVYRLIAPGYEVFSKMGIYQRDLTSFKQTPLLENTLIPGNCMNCHSFNQNMPEKMSLHIRGDLGGTIIKKGDKMEILHTKTEETQGNFVYPYWHPSGDYIVYSVNKTIQAFHAVRDHRVEVIDLTSDIVVYHPESKQVLTSDLLQTEAFETFPSFSPDGNTLYFSSSQFKNIPDEYDQIRYNLCSLSFDPETGTFGDCVDTLIHAAAMGKSISYARPSPDGKYIMFTLSDYGNFSIWHKEADLWLYDLQDGSMREMKEVNSDDVESYHSWSSEGTWFVFSSRRLDGLYTRPYFASIGKDGSITKPFLLPQNNPREFYDMTLYSYNVPEFITGKAEWNVREVERILNKADRGKVEIRR